MTKKSLTKFGPIPVKIDFQPLAVNPQVLTITRRSVLSGKNNTMDLPVTEQQLLDWLGTPDCPGRLIQDVMPHLSVQQREFLISGCLPEEWETICSDSEDTEG